MDVFYVNMTAPGQTRTVYLAFNYSSIVRGASGLRIVDGSQDSRDPCAFHAN